MKIYIENIKYYEHIKYSFETLFRCICKDKFDIVKVDHNTIFEKGIYYGNNCGYEFKGIVILEGNLFGKSFLTEESIPNVPLKKYKDLIVPFFNHKEEIGIKNNNNNVIVNVDMIQSTFFFVTGYEEAVKKESKYRDMHSRFNSKERILYKEYKYKKAIVNEYAELLCELCSDQKINLNKRESVSCAHISHDVDIPYNNSVFVRIVNVLLKKIKCEQYQLKFVSKGFKKILQIERENNINSSWYFMNTDNILSVNYGYDLQDKSIQNIIKIIKDNNKNEIGIHYSYNAAFDRYQFEKEVSSFKTKMNFSLVFGRNHYLRYDIPFSWEIYANNNIYYDTSLASAEYEGFVYGICTPFELFDLYKGINLHVWEIPLIIMEGTLIGETYRNLSCDQMIESYNFFMNEVKKHNGVFSILWHNNISSNKYINILRYVLKKINHEYYSLNGCDIINQYK